MIRVLLKGWAGFVGVLLVLTSCVSTTQEEDFQTRAERTDFQETARSAEVQDFVERVVQDREYMHLTTFGYSYEGKSLPLVVVGDVADATPETVRASGKTRVFIQGNIHAGEVCGKEALLLLLRDLREGEYAAWRDSLVLLIAPNYNADGNDRVNLNNRGRQHGPVGGMGQRPNAQNYDLNRDHMKLDSPEARSLVGMMNAYDPHVLVDLHTTNGTAHAYHLTYSPPLTPNAYPPIIQALRGEWLPEITETIKGKYGWDYYYYGNVPSRRMNAPRGWYTFDHRPRFNNNYIGLRNRLAILSEAYSYATFRDRVMATKYFVEEICDYAYQHASEIQALVNEADEAEVIGQDWAVRSQFEQTHAAVEILMGAVEQETNPYNGRPMLRRLEVRTPETMPEFGTFAATETARVPAAYYFSASLVPVLAKLTAHGITHEALTSDIEIEVEVFEIASSVASERAFQGHNERTLTGAYTTQQMTLPEGTIRVPMNQPLARLIFYLLEPRSDDGLTNWNILDRALEGADVYPIYRSVD